MDLTTREQIEALLGAYRAAELAILGMLADAAGAAGTEAWFRGQHRQLERLIRRAERLLEAAHPTEGQIQAVLANGHAEGVTAATPAGAAPAAVSAPAVGATVAEVQGALESAGAMILRETRDIYRRIAQQAAAAQITSGADNRRMLQRVIDEYANRGITGFRDRSGRRWSIDTYAEMTLRTAVNRAQNQGRIDGYRAHGVNLIKTSQHIGAHPWCIPWQNKVLALDGVAGSRTVMNNLTGREVVVEVAGTLQEAIAAGYHHTNCRHTDTAFVPWLEGEDDIQTGEEEYRAEQRQREIERHIRQWKRRRAGSFDERSNTLSEFKIRVWQEEQREHLKKYPWLTRRYDREKLWYQSTRKGGRN